MISNLKQNQIFVFGSNVAGQHLGGAAKQAYEHFGAIWDVGEGLQGQSYAFPTLSESMRRLGRRRLDRSIGKLYTCCEENPDKEFLLTKVGCGIAGYPEEDIKALFSNPPNNLILPEDWRIN